jgi:hypothetical protein
MPSARQFSGGGFLRDKDGTFVGLKFTETNPLWTGEKPANAKPSKNPDFKGLYAVVAIQEDGQDQIRVQSLMVGDASVFQPTEDGLGVIGPKGKNFGKSADFAIILESLYEAQMPIDFFPDSVEIDEQNESADFSKLVGVRARFNFRKNDYKTKKLGQREVKAKDGQPAKKFDREDLIVTNFHGTVDVSPAIAEAAAAAMADPKAAREAGKDSKPAATTAARKPAAGATTKPATAAKKVAVTPEQVAEAATSNIVAVLSKAKDFTLSDAKLSVALLNAMSGDAPELRDAVRQWALKADNLKTLAGTEHVITTKDGEQVASVNYDAAKKMMSLAVAVEA